MKKPPAKILNNRRFVLLVFIFLMLLFCGGDIVDHFLNDHLLNIDVKAHETDKAKPLEKLLVFLVCVLEGGAGEAVVLQKILDQLVDLAVLDRKSVV